MNIDSLIQEVYEEGSVQFHLGGDEEDYRFLRVLGNRCDRQGIFLGYKNAENIFRWDQYLSGRMSRGEKGQYVMIYFNDVFSILPDIMKQAIENL